MVEREFKANWGQTVNGSFSKNKSVKLSCTEHLGPFFWRISNTLMNYRLGNDTPILQLA